MDPAYLQLANRLRNVHRHRRKWARRSAVTCYRLYEKDIPDQPLIVDWYDGDAVVWTMPRTRNETADQERAWIAAVRAAVGAGLDLPEQRIFLKQRARQRDRHLAEGEREGDGQYRRLGDDSTVKVVEEQGLRFEVNLSDYLDTGLFLDHRPTRARVRGESAGRDMLNLFAYTGAFTCYARAGGARCTMTVDLSNTYLDWAGRNQALNGFAPDRDHQLVKGDCIEFLRRAPEATARYDVIICDPPTFSNSTAMAAPFSVERDHPWLLERCWLLLRPGGVCWFSTNCRGFALAGDALPPFAIEDVSPWSVPEDFRNRRIHQCWRMVRR